jgi:hypothetical protein
VDPGLKLRRGLGRVFNSEGLSLVGGAGFVWKGSWVVLEGW